MGQGQCCTTNTWSTSTYWTQITASRWPMLCHQLCAIVTQGFNIEGPPAQIAHNMRVWMWSGNWGYLPLSPWMYIICRHTSGTLWWSEERLERQFQWRPAYTVGSAPFWQFFSVFWISINHSTVSSDCIGNLWVHYKFLTSFVIWQPNFASPASAWHKLCMDLQCD